MLHRLLRLLFSRRHGNPVVSETALSTLPPAAIAESIQYKAGGNAHLAAGRLDAAVAAFRAALMLSPQAPELHVNLGFALKEQGFLDQAETSLRRAIELAHESFDAHYLLGTILANRGHLSAAIKELEAAVGLQPDSVAARMQLCRLLFSAGKIDRAKALMQAAVADNPTQPEFQLYLGNLHASTLNNAHAIACFERAIELEPRFAEAYNNLGLALEKEGRVKEAVAQFKHSSALAPAFREARRNMLFTLSYDPETSPAAYLFEAMDYGRDLLLQARPYTDWPNAMTQPTHKLRVGLLSGDLRTHPVGYFLDTLLRAWDTGGVELYAYSANPQDDELTTRLRPRFQAWHSITGASDDAVAHRIHDDGIQLLVDLAGHTDHSRLSVLAWKPAPVQVSWLGYFASTGLPTVDWFLADPISVPDQHRHHFSESIWTLPDTRLCFTPPLHDDAIPKPLPALVNGAITFGCFQALTKINDRVIAAWADVLRANPRARLRLQGKYIDDSSLRNAFLRRCSALGLDTSRLFLHSPVSRTQYLAAHNEVDLLLDTFPYTGATTTCEALWMGVPTVTLAGDRLVARQGASLLNCVGLSDWVAENVEDYVERAVRHAADLTTLAHLRVELRKRLLSSPICDAPRFALHLQDALETMWTRRKNDHT